MKDSLARKTVITLVGWLAAALLFFPIAWMALTSLKTEREAVTASLSFTPSFEGYREVLASGKCFGLA